MSALVLTVKAPPPQRVDLSPLTPERLRDRGTAEIERVELASGNRSVRVGEIFELAGGGPESDGPGEIVIRGGRAGFDFIGLGMSEGTITVEGDAGAYLGQEMQGGRLHVTGSVGPWAAAAMKGGLVEIGGNAGDFLGGALPGAMRGMSGGLVAVRGHAGERAGDRMRRGVILVEGDVGAYAGSRMIAGTLVLLGRAVGAYPGFGMKRGTLLLRQRPERSLPTFVDCGTHELGFLRLLYRSLGDIGSAAVVLEALGPRVRRFVGDQAAEGKGEILLWQS